MSLDETTLETLSYLETRLLRIEHILYGHTIPPPKTPATTSLEQLENRFATLLKRVRTYAELLKIYNAHPTLFPSSSTSTAPTPPSSLGVDALLQIILSSSPLYQSTASSLTAIDDTPIPDPAVSASLAALLPRMKAVEATQLAQQAEIAELRGRSETVVRRWYEGSVVGYGDFVAGIEGRVEGVERGVRRLERVKEDI
ncbi:nuclear distribution protein [Xylariales sp. AK1849]|nr:nuclear distribution protein [Xylariales sp. AK1849]